MPPRNVFVVSCTSVSHLPKRRLSESFLPKYWVFQFLVQLRSFEHVFPKRGILVVSSLGFRVRTCQLVCPGAGCSARALNAKEKRQDFASCFEPMQLPKRRLSESFLPKYWVFQVIGPAPELQKHVFPKRGILVVSALGFRVRICQLVCPGAGWSARTLNAKEKRQDFASCFELVFEEGSVLRSSGVAL